MLPPTIPTSFVPRPTAAGARRFSTDLSGALGFFAYGILGLMFVLSLGVFFYGQFLASNEKDKSDQLTKARSEIDLTVVKNFVRLHDRLDRGATLLANHAAFSGFFTTLNALVPATVRFTSLHLTNTDAKVPKLEGSGLARNFNALAAASAAFAADGRIKDAIFSNIVVYQKDGSVSFALSATLDPKLIAFSPDTSVTNTLPVPTGGQQGNSSTTLPSL